MNHPTNQNARGSALTTLIGGIVILLATLYFLVKLASSGYHGTVEEPPMPPRKRGFSRKVPLSRETVSPSASVKATKSSLKFVTSAMLPTAQRQVLRKLRTMPIGLPAWLKVSTPCSIML